MLMQQTLKHTRAGARTHARIHTHTHTHTHTHIREDSAGQVSNLVFYAQSTIALDKAATEILCTSKRQSTKQYEVKTQVTKTPLMQILLSVVASFKPGVGYITYRFVCLVNKSAF